MFTQSEFIVFSLVYLCIRGTIKIFVLVGKIKLLNLPIAYGLTEDGRDAWAAGAGPR